MMSIWILKIWNPLGLPILPHLRRQMSSCIDHYSRTTPSLYLQQPRQSINFRHILLASAVLSLARFARARRDHRVYIPSAADPRRQPQTIYFRTGLTGSYRINSVHYREAMTVFLRSMCFAKYEQTILIEEKIKVSVDVCVGLRLKYCSYQKRRSKNQFYSN